MFGALLRRPRALSQWRPGMQPHWKESNATLTLRQTALRLITALQLAITFLYLYYRATRTVAHVDDPLSYQLYHLLFFLAELILGFNMTVHMFELWSQVRRNCVDFKNIPNDMLAPRRHQPHSANVPKQFSNYPSIAIYITYYRETSVILDNALSAAVHIDYPTGLLSIYVCDDGNDPLKRHIVSGIRKTHPNIHYITRPKNINAKAGNLNNAFQRTSSDLIVIMDGDFIIRPHFIQRLLPYYFDWNPLSSLYEFNENLAAVQSPQNFHNISSEDHDIFNQRNLFFHSLILPGKDALNACPMIGTSNLINRAALRQVGYMSTHSVGEDTATTLRLHAKGYTTYYANEVVATGLVTTSLHDHILQHDRWGKGDWQILFSKYGPFTQPGLSLTQRFLYFNMVLHRICSIILLSIDVSIAVFLALDIPVMTVKDASTFITLVFGMSMMDIARRLVATYDSGGIFTSMAAGELFEPVFRVYNLFGLISALRFGEKVEFRSTMKEVQDKWLDKRSNSISDTSGSSTLTESSSSDELNALSSDDDCRSLCTSPRAPSKESGSWDRRQKSKRSFWPSWRLASWENYSTITKNLKSVWYSVVMALLLPSLIASSLRLALARIDANGGWPRDLSPLYFVAISYSMFTLFPHCLAVFKCFVPYVSKNAGGDLEGGYRDDFFDDDDIKKRFSMGSITPLLAVVRFFLTAGAMLLSFRLAVTSDTLFSPYVAYG